MRSGIDLITYALGKLHTEAETQAILGNDAPMMEDDALHPLIWEAASKQIACTPRPTQCLEPRSTVEVVVRASVTLPFVPPVLGLETIASVPLEAKATQTVSVFGGGNR